ncbi:RNA polymerase sigma factor [Adhaeribacter terreus]|uniref:RNA polymerase sigma factor n=1 Tax=Adhaeribacter terreus TaxID=529703 RepID=A0ABW0ED83_9BACT
MSTAVDLYEKDLIDGCIRGDIKSQKMLYKQYYGFSMAICLRYADSREEAAEIMNDGFMKVFTNLQSYQQDKAFRGWLRKIMVHTAIDHYRKNSKHYHSLDLVYAESEMGFEDVLDTISAEEILAMVQLLSPSYRLVFNLHVIEGYSHPEIAEKLQITEGASKSNLFKARMKLQKMITLSDRENRTSYAR